MFVSEQKLHDPTLTSSSSGAKWDEAWVYQHSTGEAEQITSLAGKMCNRTYMHELMVADWGIDALNAEGLATPSKLGNGGSTCQYYMPRRASLEVPARSTSATTGRVSPATDGL